MKSPSVRCPHCGQSVPVRPYQQWSAWKRFRHTRDGRRAIVFFLRVLVGAAFLGQIAWNFGTL